MAILEVKELPENSVIAYRGGGYDGCIWEWNYAYIDSEGKFHDIFSSGYKGCHDLEELAQAAEEKDTSVYRMDIEEERNRLADEEPVFRVILVATVLANLDVCHSIMPKCNHCGNRFDAAFGRPEGLHGCGGIEIAADKIICQECYDNNRCSYCGEYSEGGVTDQAKDEDGNDVELRNYACKWCIEDAIEEQKGEKDVS